ncbi:MAG: hypothetical protein ABSF98_28320 [Bryobacteraceae bacterium]
MFIVNLNVRQRTRLGSFIYDRSAVVGGTRVARRAGIQQASSATAASITGQIARRYAEQQAGHQVGHAECGDSHPNVLRASSVHVVEDTHQAVRPLERKRPQKNFIDHAEYGDVRADAQSEREDRDAGESPTLQQASNRVPNVLQWTSLRDTSRQVERDTRGGRRV